MARPSWPAPMVAIVAVILDRNGLRPFRYLVTKDQLLVMASEVGVLDVPPGGRSVQGSHSAGADVPRWTPLKDGL